jgi:hypothetical protein
MNPKTLVRVGAGIALVWITLEFYRWSKDPLPGLFGGYKYRGWYATTSWSGQDEPPRVFTYGFSPNGTKEKIETTGTTENEALQKMWARIDALIAAGYRPADVPS